MAIIDGLELGSSEEYKAEVSGVIDHGMTLNIIPKINPESSITFDTIHVYAFVKGIFQDGIPHASVTPNYTPNNNIYVIDGKSKVVRDKDKELVASREK